MPWLTPSEIPLSFGFLAKKMSPNPSIPQEKIVARVAAGTALTIAAGHASESLDKLAMWFLAAFGAGLALTVSNLKEVSDFIPVSAIASAAHLFIWASVLCMAQRYVAMVVGCGVLSAKDGRELGEKLKDQDIGEFISQMKMGMPALLRPLINGSLNSVLANDFAAGGRLMIRLALVQGLLATVEVGILLVAISSVLNEI